MYWKIFGAGTDQLLAAKGFTKEGSRSVPSITLQKWEDKGGEQSARISLVLSYVSIEDRDNGFYKLDKYLAEALIQDSLTEMKEQA